MFCIWIPWVHVRLHHATRSHRGSWTHVRLPRTKHYPKNFPQKHIAIPMTRGSRIRDWPGLKNLALSSFMVNRCAVLWCGRDLWVETAQTHLPCFALSRKTTPNKQRTAKLYKMAMNWAQVTQKKQQQTQVYVSTIYCLRRDFAQKAKSRGGTLVTRAYIKESTYSWNIQS